MGDLLLVDTDILIDGARARPEAISFLQAYERTHTLSLSLVLGIPLATKNRRDYQFIKGLELIPYPLRIAHGGNS